MEDEFSVYETCHPALFQPFLCVPLTRLNNRLNNAREPHGLFYLGLQGGRQGG